MAIITISRQYGSGGSDVAARVAEALGWTLLDNALIDQVAERLGMSREEVSRREERVPSLVERLAEAMTLATPEWVPAITDAPPPRPEARLAEVTRRVVEEAVARGPVVVVGRGAPAMLAARGDALHVFCYAPKAVLVRRVAERLQVPAAEAERVVADTNRQREQYVKEHWGRAWGAYENYDLCVNTGTLGVEGAAGVVVDVARVRFG
ncbi:MAG TPA: cytidylate kinase-like family protein [Gemmatimonadaceae bacterium]|nr:cytidylate kinase-like family protein [Gemmatimonadaceae bacterium]